LATCPDYAPYVEKMLQPVQKQSLSQAALETLAVVAYRQPVTRLDVEMVRGVKCDYSIQSLVNKQLIAEAGRKDTVGRPILYATTDRFLSHFGLTSLQDLPEPILSLPQEREDALPDEAAKEQIIPGNQTETAETI
jgi:segregation and condensation protein B